MLPDHHPQPPPPSRGWCVWGLLGGETSRWLGDVGSGWRGHGLEPAAATEGLARPGDWRMIERLDGRHGCRPRKSTPGGMDAAVAAWQPSQGEPAAGARYERRRRQRQAGQAVGEGPGGDTADRARGGCTQPERHGGRGAPLRAPAEVNLSAVGRRLRMCDTEGRPSRPGRNRRHENLPPIVAARGVERTSDRVPPSRCRPRAAGLRNPL